MQRHKGEFIVKEGGPAPGYCPLPEDLFEQKRLVEMKSIQIEWGLDTSNLGIGNALGPKGT